MKENSIKKDIEKVENLIKRCEECKLKECINCETSYTEIMSVKRIVDSYKKVLKENEELKEERQIVGIPVRNKRDGRIGIVLHQWESGSVAVLESINPRVINTHDSWNTLEIVTDEVKQTQTKCETIPVQEVKDKIEELKEQYTVRELDFIKTTQDIRNIIIQSLEELLEGEN